MALSGRTNKSKFRTLAIILSVSGGTVLTFTVETMAETLLTAVAQKASNTTEVNQIHLAKLANVESRVLKQAAIEFGRLAQTPIPGGMRKLERSAMIENAALAENLQETLDRIVWLREQLTDLRERLTELRASLTDAHAKGSDTAALEAEIARIEARIAKMEHELQTMTGRGEMLTMELQNAMQKQARTLRTLSNIMKSQHDTLKAIIQNMK